VSDGGCRGYQPKDEGWGGGRRPVINVSWRDAKAYLAWLSRRTGQNYRLLTDAEWEYAARAGSAKLYWWGDRVVPNRANCVNCGAPYNRKAPSDVGLYPPNGFGLHDMSGGVWEWVEDCWNESYAGAPSDGKAWRLGDCSRRVLRGGSWDFIPRNVRAAYRYGVVTGVRDFDIGFRIARTLF